MLKVENLSIQYGGIRAVRDISFAAAAGKVTVIIGNNGAGKSSTLRCITGLVPRTQGSVFFEGQDISGEKAEKIARDIGMIHVPEGRHVFPRLTVRENLLMSWSPRTGAKKDFLQEMDRVLSRFDILKKRYNQMAGTLSGGEQQMLAIARGVLQKPRLLILDEPSMGLAPLVVEEVFAIIREINATGVTTLVVEQNALVALSAADYGYVMESGKIIMQGPASDMLGNPDVQKIYLGEE